MLAISERDHNSRSLSDMPCNCVGARPSLVFRLRVASLWSNRRFQARSCGQRSYARVQLWQFRGFAIESAWPVAIAPAPTAVGEIPLLLRGTRMTRFGWKQFGKIAQSSITFAIDE